MADAFDLEAVDWLASILAEWESSGALYTRTAEAIVATFQRRSEALKLGQSYPFPDAQDLMKALETRGH